MHLGMADCPVPFGVTVILTADLVSRISITSIFFEVGIPNLVCGWMLLVMGKCCIPFLGHCNLDL